LVISHCRSDFARLDLGIGPRLRGDGCSRPSLMRVHQAQISKANRERKKPIVVLEKCNKDVTLPNLAAS
jgi:hypothetical protein